MTDRQEDPKDEKTEPAEEKKPEPAEPKKTREKDPRGESLWTKNRRMERPSRIGDNTVIRRER